MFSDGIKPSKFHDPADPPLNMVVSFVSSISLTAYLAASFTPPYGENPKNSPGLVVVQPAISLTIANADVVISPHAVSLSGR